MTEKDSDKCVHLEVAIEQAENEYKRLGHIKGCYGYIQTGCITADRNPSCCGFNLSCYNYFPYRLIDGLNNRLEDPS